MNTSELTLDEIIKKKFRSYSNQQLCDRINRANDFQWDDEGYEMSRRMKESNGALKFKMYYNTLRLIKENNVWLGKFCPNDHKDYYNVGLDLSTGTVHIFKNFSCDADVLAFCKDGQLNIDKLYFNGNQSTPDFTRIPKKYHKLF